MKQVVFFTIVLVYLLVQPAFSFSKKNQASNVSITGDISGSKYDQIQFGVMSEVYLKTSNYKIFDTNSLDAPEASSNQFKSISVNGQLALTLRNVSSYKFCYLRLSNTVIKNLVDEKSFLLVEPGDKVKFSFVNNEPIFTGKQAKRYNCAVKLSDIERKLIISGLRTSVKQKNVLAIFQKCDSAALISFKVLDQYRNKLTEKDFQLLKIRILANYQREKILYFEAYGAPWGKDYNSAVYREIKDYINPIWNKKVVDQLKKMKRIDSDKAYIDLIRQQYQLDSCTLLQKKMDINKYYDYIVSNYFSSMRDWLIADAVMYSLTNREWNSSNFIARALKANILNAKGIRDYLRALVNLTPGAKAYNFELPDVNSNMIHQSDLKGKVVVLDTWHHGCGPCALLHPVLDSVKTVINNPDFIIVSVFQNVTNETIAQWKNLIQSGIYTSDHNLNVYLDHPPQSQFNNYYKIMADPTLILIGKNGVLTEQPVDPRADKGKSLIRIVKENLN